MNILILPSIRSDRAVEIVANADANSTATVSFVLARQQTHSPTQSPLASSTELVVARVAPEDLHTGAQWFVHVEILTGRTVELRVQQLDAEPVLRVLHESTTCMGVVQ